jgi:hypothetical protein
LRLRSDIYVAAYLRRCASLNVPAVLRRRGDGAAGAIFVSVDHGDGRATLYAPSSGAQSDDPAIERLWRRAHKEEAIDSLALAHRMAREISFDGDLWWIEVDDREGRHGLDIDPL